MISIRSARLGSRFPISSFSLQLRRHRAVTRAAIAAISLALAVAVSSGGAAQAGLSAMLTAPPSILPVSVGESIGTNRPALLTFEHPMEPATVEGGFSLAPSHAVHLSWSDDRRTLEVDPDGLWASDARYTMVVAGSARTAAGALLGAPARFTFTTAAAPRITEFGVTVAPEAVGQAPLELGASDPVQPPADHASGVSAETSITITFSAPMNRPEVERAFLLSPSVPGLFRWFGSTLTFTPVGRLAADARYAVSLAGIHDAIGNPLAGDASFSFTTRAGAQLVRSTPADGASGVSDSEIVLWFSEPVDTASVGAALRVSDAASGAALTGELTWNSSRTQLRFTPTRALPAGHRFEVSVGEGGLDADGNPVVASLSFTTRSAVARRTIPRAAPSATLTGYALNQVNAARAAYGLPPLVYDKAIEAVALAHAWDEIQYNYFSHTGRDGSTQEDRLSAAGLSFGWNGENQCMNNNTGRTTTQTLDWCQAQFMSEPYPGVANHIGNILSTHYKRVGIGIAISGAKVVVVWDFTD